LDDPSVTIPIKQRLGDIKQLILFLDVLQFSAVVARKKTEFSISK
jgi:hypothetical protein